MSEKVALESKRTQEDEPVKKPLKTSSKQLKNVAQSEGYNFHFNLFEIMVIFVCPGCAWKKLRKKNLLLKKALSKLFFQLDILNFLKNMQLIELLNYSLLEPNESMILHFLAKPSISLAQKKDIYETIRNVNDIGSKEIDDLYIALKSLFEKKGKTQLQKRILKLAGMEMKALIKKIKTQ